MKNVILNKIYPLIEVAMDKKSEKEIQKIVSAYLDKNTVKLTTSGPVYRTIFSDSDKNAIFDLLQVDQDYVKKTILESDDIKKSWINATNPFSIVMVMIIRYAKITKNNPLMVSAIMYLTLSMYPSLHAKYFKYEPNKEIMEYTISNLSDKFRVKRSATIWEALLDTTVTCDKTYSNDVVRCSDKDIVNYILAYKTRLNSILKLICDNFMKNHENQNYLNLDKEVDDGENYIRADNNSYLIERTADSVSIKLSTNGPDMKLVTISAKLADISVNDLRNTTNDLCTDKRNVEDIKSMARAILTNFLYTLQKSQTEIKSNTFLIDSLEIYRKTNVSDKNLIFIKSKLDDWLNRYSETFKKTNRIATLNNFRKALFIFFVLTVQKFS